MKIIEIGDREYGLHYGCSNLGLDRRQTQNVPRPRPRSCPLESRPMPTTISKELRLEEKRTRGVGREEKEK